MPELPEVETLRRELARVLPGQVVKTVIILNSKSVSPLSPTLFTKRMARQKIKSVDRRAKMLIVDFEGKDALVFHLKMTGQLIFVPKTPKKKVIVGGHPVKDQDKYARIIFEFNSGDKLIFNDLRKFGWARLVDDSQISKMINSVGIEPLSVQFTLDAFSQILTRYPNRPIKQILMDQTLIAGIGNIYADESCFIAKILPTRKAANIKPAERKKLHQAIIEVLKLSIAQKGTSSKNYVRSDGRPGGFVPFLNVYGRAGEKCKRCGGTIKKIKLNGRGTHFCPDCQK